MRLEAILKSPLFTRLIGPSTVFVALLAALAEIFAYPEVLSTPSVLLAKAEFAKRWLFLLTFALVGVKAHHTFGHGKKLIQLRKQVSFRTSELIWWGVLTTAMCVTLLPYRVGIPLVVFALVPLAILEIKAIHSLKKSEGKPPDLGRL